MGWKPTVHLFFNLEEGKTYRIEHHAPALEGSNETWQCLYDDETNLTTDQCRDKLQSYLDVGVSDDLLRIIEESES